MTRASGTVVENSFRQGLITEASGLNFPENSCTETYNCIFSLTGQVSRRLGFDFEENFQTKTIDRTDSAISTYLWKNVAGDGNTTLYVTQVGGTIYFYNTSALSISAGAVTSNVALSTFKDSGAPDPKTIECQFSSGSKYLVVTHPYCKPFYVSFNTSTNTATATAIELKIRDFEGDLADTLAVDTRPTATLSGLDIHHKYNLYNQGWNTTNLTAWDTSQTTMPSNADVMWAFKNADDAFDMTTLANVINGNTPAPKGHFILTASAEDRDTASGLSGTTTGGSGSQHPSTSAFFSGRVFYAGVHYVGKNSRIYYSQILERDDQYGMCYQASDPTSEDLFDIVDSDGGVLDIPEAGTIYKLVSVAGSLIVFANNGVWAISGSTGLGFKATDFSVQKMSSVATISASSFVDIAGYPAWWTADGIYMLTTDGNSPQIKSLTLGTIKTYYDSIPRASKLTAKGYFHIVSGVVQWVFRGQTAADSVETYSYTHILNYNVSTNAFYPWTITDSNVKVNSVVVLDGTVGSTDLVDVIDDSSNTVVDDSGNSVITTVFNAAGTASPLQFIYLVSYADSGSYKMTFAGTKNLSYLDWALYSTPVDYTSYFITGYKVHGDGIRKFQPTFINLFSETPEPVSYFIQGVWDYAITNGIHRWSIPQLVQHSDTDFATSMARRKLRGHGKVLQFKVTSETGSPFYISGWSIFETGNSQP